MKVCWVILLAACGTTGVEVKSYFVDGADFASRQTYTWRAPEATGDTRINEMFVDQNVRHAVNDALIRKGYSITPNDAPGFSVGYRAVLQHKRDRVEKTGYGSESAGVWDDDYQPRDTRPRDVERGYYVGRLILEFKDPKSGDLLWRGSGAMEVNPKAGPETRRIRIKKLVKKLLNEFPKQP